MVEGRTDVEHAPWGEGGALLYQIYHGQRPLSAPECGGLIFTAQHIPIPGSGLPMRSHDCHALTLSQETEALPTRSTENPGRCLPPVHGAPGGHPQDILAVMVLTDVYLTIYLSDH